MRRTDIELVMTNCLPAKQHVLHRRETAEKGQEATTQAATLEAKLKDLTQLVRERETSLPHLVDHWSSWSRRHSNDFVMLVAK